MRVRYSFSSRRTGNIENMTKQRVKYPDAMRKVMEISDVVLQVLDARFAVEMRNYQVENDLKNLGKKTVFVLNKADLINVKEVEKTLPDNMRPHVFVSSTTGQGAKDLRDRIKIEAKRVVLDGEKQRVHVGVIGYPNAGKSSLINLITRRGVAKVSKQAGFTKGIQKIKLVEGILILDTPGVIPDKEYSTDDEGKRARDAKVGARTYSDVKDPEYVLYEIMKQHPGILEQHYNIEKAEDPEILIETIGRKKNLLKKGGVVDTDRTARTILKEWQAGTIKVV